MAHKTAEQRDVQTELEQQYGKANRVGLARTHEPYGILWLHWDNAIEGAELGSRNLFVMPDGDRMTWVFE